MTLRQKQCVQCGDGFVPTLRHPHQKTCGKKCPGSYSIRRDKVLVERRSRYRTDASYRDRVVERSWLNGLKRYGVDVSWYEEKLREQLGCCAICGCDSGATSKFGRAKRLFVDHDHETGKARGLLCGRCNVAIGALDDSSKNADRAAGYLREYGK